MKDIKHVHEVIFFLQRNQDEEYPISLFPKILKKEFGDEITFRSCSEEGMSPDEVVGFLFNKGKILIVNECIRLHPDLKLCDGHLH
ncbi:DUF2492 family protein [Aureibacter tunicatorum]|uniref:Metal-binding protein n=1 Tax=Aureibacter tunicatorum TaxID=866807 RepID=A0AAE3XM75_9BACT|nr:DUF2492 family protein [Aureibacter tunicatorum]MDR6239163.1 putative metal-binding protein [Aureibacter tunicatorum]BDD04911.1 hypothetical protein AUTU_23940 [Aureibacter tunicatorum]